MKNLMRVSALGLAVVLAAGCQQKTDDAAPKLETDVQKQAYALGASVGTFLARNMEENGKMGITFDNEVVLAGLKDGLNNNSQYTQEEIQTLLQNLDKELKQKRMAEMAKLNAENKSKGETFLAENGKREGVMTTESGLQYEVVEAGEGDKPAATDTVSVHYTGTLIDGTKFDSSVDRGQPATFALNAVIPGWTEGVQLMSKGAKYKFFIPAALAYGDNGAGSIPPNSVLVFDVELLDIVK